MDAIKIAAATRTEVGASQGYIGISIRDEVLNFEGIGDDIPVMVTAWRPTAEEIGRIMLGDPVILRVLGRVPPPVMLSVGDAP